MLLSIQRPVFHIRQSDHFNRRNMVVFLLLLLIPNSISQIIPQHINFVIDRMRQEQFHIPPDIGNFVEYNVTPEQMLNNMLMSWLRNATDSCEKDFEIILRAALKHEIWAMKVIDAWGKPLPSGILSGNIYWVGNYDECLQDMYLTKNKSFVSQPFETQYCE